jgi:hypothetical protein
MKQKNTNKKWQFRRIIRAINAKVKLGKADKFAVNNFLSNIHSDAKNITELISSIRIDISLFFIDKKTKKYTQIGFISTGKSKQ